MIFCPLEPYLLIILRKWWSCKGNAAGIPNLTKGVAYRIFGNAPIAEAKSQGPLGHLSGGKVLLNKKDKLFNLFST
jgi:hypothetical protein